jgi:hypothetical protein
MISTHLSDDVRSWLTVRVISVAFYLTLSLLYLLAIPFGESPDEPGHLQCIQQVALLNRIPIVDPKPTGEWWRPGAVLSGRMCYHMPAYYLLAGSVQKLIGGVSGTSLEISFPATNEAFGESGVMFIHPEKTISWALHEPLAVTGLRVISIFLGAITVWVTISVAQILFPASPTTGLAAGILVGGWPQFLFLSRAISNDVLANAFSVLALLALLNVGKPKRFVLATLWATLAVFTKINMIFVVGVALFVWLIEIIHFREQRRELLRSGLFASIILVIGATVVAVNPTIQTNLWLSGRTFSSISERVFTIEYWLEVNRLTLSSGFARFGWMSVAVEDWVVYLWWSLMTFLIAMGGLQWWRRKEPFRWLLMVVIIAWLAGNLASYLRINLTVMQPQFRFLQSTLPLIAAFAAGGLSTITIFGQRFFIFTLTVGLLLINLWIVFYVVAPVYGLSM